MLGPLQAGKTKTLSKSQMVLHKYVYVTLDGSMEMRTGIQ